MDLDVASLDDDVMNAHGLTLFQFVRNVSQDVQSSLHDIKIVGLSLCCNILIVFSRSTGVSFGIVN